VQGEGALGGFLQREGGSVSGEPRGVAGGFGSTINGGFGAFLKRTEGGEVAESRGRVEEERGGEDA
jgi:hypothetical protein